MLSDYVFVLCHSVVTSTSLHTSSSTLGTQGKIINLISRSKVQRMEPDKNVEEESDER